MVTIYDIAKQANTSAVTVSLALRNSKRVSESTRQKIHEIAREYGYRPNPLARGLVGAKTKTIAFVFNFSSNELSHDLSYMEYFHAIAQAAAERGYKIYFHSSTEAIPIEKLIEDISLHRVDGMVLGTELTDSDREILRKTDIPTVIVGRDIRGKKLTSVSTDDYDGIRQAVEHLLSLGHKRIAFVGKSSRETAIARYESYRETMSQAGIPIDDELIIETSYDMDAGEYAGRKLGELENPPTAVVAASDLLAIGIISGLKHKGLKVPDDVSVTGYDNLHISQFTVPALTTIDLLRMESGKIVIDALLGLITGKREGEKIRTEVKLIVRDSTRRITRREERREKSEERGEKRET